MTSGIVDGRALLLAVAIAVLIPVYIRARHHDRQLNRLSRGGARSTHWMTICYGCGTILYRTPDSAFRPSGPCMHEGVFIAPAHIPYHPFD